MLEHGQQQTTHRRRVPVQCLQGSDRNGEQFERLQQQFYDNFSGASNSGKPFILEGGLKWQETSNAERFEKFLELRSLARKLQFANRRKPWGTFMNQNRFFLFYFILTTLTF